MILVAIPNKLLFTRFVMFEQFEWYSRKHVTCLNLNYFNQAQVSLSFYILVQRIHVMYLYWWNKSHFKNDLWLYNYRFMFSLSLFPRCRRIPCFPCFSSLCFVVVSFVMSTLWIPVLGESLHRSQGMECNNVKRKNAAVSN